MAALAASIAITTPVVTEFTPMLHESASPSASKYHFKAFGAVQGWRVLPRHAPSSHRTPEWLSREADPLLLRGASLLARADVQGVLIPVLPPLSAACPRELSRLGGVRRSRSLSLVGSADRPVR